MSHYLHNWYHSLISRLRDPKEKSYGQISSVRKLPSQGLEIPATGTLQEYYSNIWENMGKRWEMGEDVSLLEN